MEIIQNNKTYPIILKKNNLTISLRNYHILR
uniref:Uncharacterized protein n=1 Tax=viral metagenome TaxID=1070528 RepID=A0A6C0LUB5_9ZZZZ